MSAFCISILGCGWLGFPLARELLKRGYRVKGSTTTSSKLEDLNREGIESYLIDIPPDGVLPSNVGDFFKTDVLFINIPFRRSLVDPFVYHRQVMRAAESADESGAVLVFAGSTSVYPDNVGMADERVEFIPEGLRGKVLRDLETALLGFRNVMILRLAGLFGPDRNLAGFSPMAKHRHPDSPVNLVHLDDCLSIIQGLIERPAPGEIFNVCCDEHPTRRELYTRLAVLLDQPVPVFEADGPAPVKIVANAKIKRYLNYRFKYAHPVSAYEKI